MKLHYKPIYLASAAVVILAAAGITIPTAYRFYKNARGKKPLLTTFSIYNLARNNDFDSSKARRELGYHTRSYRETMHDEIAWLKATGKIGSVQV